MDRSITAQEISAPREEVSSLRARLEAEERKRDEAGAEVARLREAAEKARSTLIKEKAFQEDYQGWGSRVITEALTEALAKLDLQKGPDDE